MATSPEALIVSFLGWSDSGKTTLIVGLIEECRTRGISCAAAKCTRHPGDFEDRAKDSARYREAGASPVAFIGSGEGGTTTLFMATPAIPDRVWLKSLFPLSHIILVEGLEVEASVRVLVARAGKEPKKSFDLVELLVSEDESQRSQFTSMGKRAFEPWNLVAIMDSLEATWKGK